MRDDPLGENDGGPPTRGHFHAPTTEDDAPIRRVAGPHEALEVVQIGRSDNYAVFVIETTSQRRRTPGSDVQASTKAVANKRELEKRELTPHAERPEAAGRFCEPAGRNPMPWKLSRLPRT
jgi:hypothetical protein